MKNNFWSQLPKPFFALAPMADVTDVVFREIVAKCSRHGEQNGGPDVFWTEFVSADGLESKGRELLLRDLAFQNNEHPIVAQLFSSNPRAMRFASRLCAELGFDGIDINMGCPDRSIEKQGAGACMIKTPDVAEKIIEAVHQGIQDAGKEIPVSVKTRVGYHHSEISTWIQFLLSQNIQALTIHARTRRDLSKVPANWDYVRQVVELRNKMGKSIPIIGNGDVHSISDGEKKVKETGCDGIMIGRAIFGNPWLFDRKRYVIHEGKYRYSFIARLLPNFLAKKLRGKDIYTLTDISLKEKLQTLVEHAKLFETKLGDCKNFAIMKKHMKAYAQGFKGAKELRIQLMETENAHQVEKIVKEFLASHTSKEI